jgi:outer membrane protein OmpA-like peptidoglycan-associated protein
MNRGLGASLLFLLTFCFTPLQSQSLSNKEFIKAVQTADISYYYDEDFVKAASLYEPLLKARPDNSNLAAKLGICYLNMDGKDSLALSLLKKASLNVVSKDKDYVEYGDKAPLDTYLYLGEAYHVNDSLQKAIIQYTNFKKSLAETEVFRMDYVDNQIRDCRYALEMKKKPLTIISQLFIPWLEKFPGAINPVLAKNDSVFIFTQKTDQKTRIFCSYKKDGVWDMPSDITKKLGGLDRLLSNSITGDGKFLVLYLDDGGDGNLYYSIRKDTTWSKIKSFGKPVNTIYWESHGFITPDNSRLFLSSNRPGTLGELDIWVAERRENGTWQEPVNCGEVINTPFNEDTPFFDPDNNALLFSSVGHISMGGYDVFRSVYRNGGWTNPVGLPYSFNTCSGNNFFILNNNKPGFITSKFDPKTKSRNIFTEVAIDPADELTTASGTVSLSDGLSVDPAKASILLFDIKKKTEPTNISMKEDGSFTFGIIPGDYQVLVSHKGYKTDTININLPLYFLSHYMALNPKLKPEKKSAGEQFLDIRNILFEYNSFKLDSLARAILEQVKSVLMSYPNLKIEVAGYTDSKGTPQYNMNLADKRASAVINYLVSESVPASRFVRKSFGQSNFAAPNTNLDGSDNPEGRKYNRRVTFGIIDPKTGVVIRQETYTPERLRHGSSMKFSIVLEKSREKIDINKFSNLNLNSMQFIRTISYDSTNMCVLGVFYNHTDAIKYLETLKGQGYSNAYIVNQYFLNHIIRENATLTPIVSEARGKKVYTVQLKAAIIPINMSLFKNFADTREIISEDGIFRYVTGEYSKYSDALKAQKAARDAGFADSFIRELNLLLNK